MGEALWNSMKNWFVSSHQLKSELNSKPSRKYSDTSKHKSWCVSPVSSFLFPCQSARLSLYSWCMKTVIKKYSLFYALTLQRILKTKLIICLLRFAAGKAFAMQTGIWYVQVRELWKLVDLRAGVNLTPYHKLKFNWFKESLGWG